MTTQSYINELQSIQDEILKHVESYGLRPFRTIFELISHDEMNEIAAYGGFPTRYPHWRFGMEYEELQKGYSYGLQKIYELVINNDPCYAYLMKSNSLVDQKMVIAHVYGHSDFFRNNLWFSQTNRHMIDDIASHGTRIRKHVEKHGKEIVENFIDTVLSLEYMIDYHSVYSPIQKRKTYQFDDNDAPTEIRKLHSTKGYLDRYINPPEFLERQRKKIEEQANKKRRFPEEPVKDILEFMIEYAPLENWQRDVISIVREESYYFAPQALTKIQNEGWASFWHAKTMTERVLGDDEIIDFADHNSGVLGGNVGTINPYKLGLELWHDIEDRWNKGRFGREYDECDDLIKKENWDLKLGLGREKIFEVRKIYNDITFIDEFLTKEFCIKHKLFVYQHNKITNQYEISDRDFAGIKRNLLFRLTNMGHPIIAIVDGNYKNRAELLLKHYYDGNDLDRNEARDTLVNLYKLWQRPISLETSIDNNGQVWSYDGEKHTEALSV